LFIVSNLNAQNTISTVIYKKKVTYNLDKAKEGKAKTLLQNVSSVVKDLEYELVFDSKESVYSKKEFLKPENLNSLNLIIMEMGFGSGIYYMNCETNKYLFQTNLSSDLFLIESKKPQKWKKTNETKQIGKYNCFKATTTVFIETVSAGTIEEEVIAWFTPEIPVSFGPAGFGGLPGLIMEIEKGKAVIYAHKVYLGTAKDKKINIPKRGIKVSEEEFREILKKGSSYYGQYKN